MTKHPSIDDTLAQVEARVVQFEQELAEGKQLNMQGFEERIHALCEEIGRLPKERAGDYEPRLKAMSKALQALSLALSRQYEAVKGQLTQIETKNKAQEAYSRAIKTKPDDKK